MTPESTSSVSNDTFVSQLQKASLFAIASALRSIGYRFTTGTPKTHATVNKRLENRLGESPMDIYGWSRPYVESAANERWHHLNLEAGIAIAEENAWRSTLRVSTMSDRYYFHSAYPTEAKDSVFFGPDTYRFINALESRLPRLGRVQRALEIGSGSGAAAVTIALAFPLATVIASDINTAAVRLTQINAELAGLKNVYAGRSDLYQAVDGGFDLIVANPPYLIDRESRHYRDGGGKFGEALSVAIVMGALERLNGGGTLFLYTGSVIVNGEDVLLNALQPILSGTGLQWSYRELDPDVFGEELEHKAYANVDRIAIVWLEITKTSDKNYVL